MHRDGSEQSSAASPVGKHYSGDLGERYFQWQQGAGHLGAALTVPYFAPHLSASDRVVDFGCGGAFLLELLPGREKVGIEPNPSARRAALERGLRVETSAAELPEGFADVVVSCHALEHTLRPLDELQGVLRLLRPGGRLVLLLPMDDWRMQRAPDPEDINHHLYTWTPLLLANLLDEAGYVDVRTQVITRAWPPFHEILYKVLPRGAFDVLGRAWAVLRRRRQVMAVAHRPT